MGRRIQQVSSRREVNISRRSATARLREEIARLVLNLADVSKARHVGVLFEERSHELHRLILFVLIPIDVFMHYEKEGG